MSLTKFPLLVLFLYLFIPSDRHVSPIQSHREKKINYLINDQLLNNHGLQYFIEIKDKKMNSIEKFNTYSEDFKICFKPLDIHNYWEKKGNEDYYIILNKASYLMDKKVSYFTKDLLCNEKYIQQTLPDYTIKKTDDVNNKFHIKCGAFAPEFDFDLKYYKAPYDHNSTALSLLSYIKKYNPELGEPQVLTVQHNYDFSKVLFQKTSKMSIAVYAYFPHSEEKTLVMNYTLNYVYNLPPKIVGGHKYIMDMIIDGMEDLVVHTRQVNEKHSKG